MHRIRNWAHQKAQGAAPLASVSRTRSNQAARPQAGAGVVSAPAGPVAAHDGAEASNAAIPIVNAPSMQPPDASAENEKTDATATARPSVTKRFFLTFRDILLSSYVNVLLVFVPVGIAAHFAKLSAGIVFSMNAIAIIPLAGLLSHATESVASRLGDTIGALLNVTFGNAVELIIFIALVKDEIEIVQASLVGSILSNLLLILGMCFLLGGLRYREQIYNSTVTQMSACLLSLSVSSLLLPTAFHASFSDASDADTKVLEVSRGTSVVLLLVYLLYLVFQLNSHSYMYESTPREVIERESHPGPVANYFNSSSSDSDSSSSSSSSSSNSDLDQSRSTAKRFKRALKKRGNKIRNRHASSADTTDAPNSPTDPVAESASASAGANATTTANEGRADAVGVVADIGAVADDEADGDDAQEEKRRHKKKQKHKKKKKAAEINAIVEENQEDINTALAASGVPVSEALAGRDPRRVDFALAPDVEAQTNPRPAPFSLRALANPKILSKTLSVNVFNAPVAAEVGASGQPGGSRSRSQLRRTSSLPIDPHSYSYRQQPGALPPIVPIVVNRTPRTIVVAGDEEDADGEPELSRTTSILLLLASTGLVALCAEFMVDSINEVVSSNSGVSETFIGLIVLPIVGNAAEHVTGVTVAMKNKMDLALGVALGSSIQIAIFVTPVVVLLGWIMDKNMSLYFTLFETVSMFVSAFIVNFLVLDGRSNYLEGALLCAAYVIISVAAFFYPGKDAANELGGGNATHTAVNETAKFLVRSLVNLKERS